MEHNQEIMEQFLKLLSENGRAGQSEDLYRVETLRGMGYDPYVMVYDRPTAPKITRQLQRWVNNKRIFYTVKNFSDYIPNRTGGTT